MIPQLLLSTFGPMLLKGAMNKFGKGLLGEEKPMSAGAQSILSQEAPTLFASMQGGNQAAPQGGLLSLQSSGGQSSQTPSADLPGYAPAINLGRSYQRRFKGLIS